MNDYILTLAIPAYNMEKYLDRCLKSVLLPELEPFIEVLLVNDGSKDSTLEIAYRWEKEHKALRVIDKPNGGWGSAINLAISEAKGKYFKILDSDDWFDPDAFILFIDILKSQDADLIATSYSKVYDDKETERIDFNDELLGQQPFYNVITINSFLSPFPMATLCYKTQILKGLKVAERYYADVEYALIPTRNINVVYAANLNLYQYYLSRDEHSTSMLGYKRHYQDYITMMLKLVSYYEFHKNDMDEIMSIYLTKEILCHVRFSYDLLMSLSFRGSNMNSKLELENLDSSLKNMSTRFYKGVTYEKKKGLPYIWIWRKTRINILRIREWIS